VHRFRGTELAAHDCLRAVLHRFPSPFRSEISPTRCATPQFPSPRTLLTSSANSFDNSPPPGPRSAPTLVFLVNRLFRTGFGDANLCCDSPLRLRNGALPPVFLGNRNGRRCCGWVRAFRSVHSNKAEAPSNRRRRQEDISAFCTEIRAAC